MKRINKQENIKTFFKKEENKFIDLPIEMFIEISLYLNFKNMLNFNLSNKDIYMSTWRQSAMWNEIGKIHFNGVKTKLKEIPEWEHKPNNALSFFIPK